MVMFPSRNEGKLRQKELRRELSRIVRECKRLGYRKVILFGSLARGEVGPRSDIDLILVKDSEMKFSDRLEEFYREIIPDVAVDVLVYTPEEFDRLRRERAFIRKAVEEGVILYDAEGGNGRGTQMV